MTEENKGNSDGNDVHRGVVEGQVTGSDGNPLPGVDVQAYRRLLKGEDFLSRDRTNAEGHYRISYVAKRVVHLVVKVEGEKGRWIAVSPVLFNAREKETVDLAATAPADRGPSEYEIVSAKIQSRWGGTNPAELTSEQVAYLQGDTGADPLAVAAFAAAARLAAKTSVVPEAWYGLIRAGLSPVLEVLLAQSPSTQAHALETALKRNWIPARLGLEKEKILAQLRGLIAQKALTSGANNQATVGDLLFITIPDRQEQEMFLNLYTAHTGNRAAFWADLQKHPQFEKKAERLRWTLQVGVLTRNHSSLVKELTQRQQRGEISSLKDLARWDEKDWQAVLNQPNGNGPIGAPSTVPGKDAAEKMATYARAMTRLLEDAFPTTALFGRLAKDDVPQKDALLAFEKSNSDFVFDGVPVEKYLADHPLALEGIPDKTVVTEELKSYQRLSKFAPTYEKMRVMKKNGVTSAQCAMEMGKTAFMKMVGPGMGETEATKAYNKASLVSASSLSLVADMAPGFNMGSASLPYTMTSGEGIPDWESLFGSLDLCACEHCRSVLSPAAYLVDGLHFLKKRDAIPVGKNAKDILFKRRSDLGKIELTCPNTNTPLPYVDLVNELLEETVSPGTGTPAADRQTRASAAELAANPEYLNGGAYDALKQHVFPWPLPFDLWTEEVRTYLDHLGVSRAEVMEIFRSTTPAPEAVAAERLGLNRVERLIVTADYGSLTPARQVQEFWGFSAPAPVGWVAQTAHVRAFLDKSNLTYDQLNTLLTCAFINPAADLRVESTDPDEPHTCDTTKLIIVNLTASHLDRIHRFIRLWRATGWTLLELDKTISALQSSIVDVNARITNGFLTTLARIQTLKERLRLPVETLRAFWAKIDIHDVGETPSLYKRLFQNPAITKPVDLNFTLAAGELAIVAGDPVNAKISTHSATLLAGLNASAQDLACLTETEVVDDALTLANLSALYRTVSLARALKMSVRDVVTLKSLSGINPFDAADTSKVLRFIDAAETIRSAHGSVAGLDYLLRHMSAPSSGLAPSESSQAVMLDQIRASLQRIAAENTFSPEPPDLTGEGTKNKLSVILTESDVDMAMSLLNGSWTDVTAKNTFIDDHFAPFLEVTDAKNKLVGPHASFLPLTNLAARYAYVLAPLTAYLRRTLSEAAVKQDMASSLSLEFQVTSDLLTTWVMGVTDGTRPALEEFLAASFAESDSVPMTRANFPGAFTLFTRLQKIAGIIDAFDVTSLQAAWLFEDSTTAGWLNPATLPATETDAPASFEAWERMVNLFQLRDDLSLGEAALQAIFTKAKEGGVTKSAVLDEVSARTDWNRDDLEFLDGASGFSFVFPTAYQDGHALGKLKGCFDALKRLGVSAAQARSWTGESPTESQARAARQAAAAKHDASRWLDLAKPLRDVLREKQRGALVAYLVPRANALLGQHWHDVNDLYAHFLIDVEMTPVMMSSRIKQAMLSVQLFVQRCLMNLETEVLADAGADPDWMHWKWMKNYRVWEANRKVFLWPENWIEPDLRDDKSPYFKEMEDELLQAEVTTDTAEDAFTHYVEKLDGVARLEVIGSYHDRETNAGGQIVVDNYHVIARTHANPHVYFHRLRHLDTGVWTPWEKIDLEIEGNIVIPVVWNRRLHLIWPQFLLKTEEEAVTMPGAHESLGTPDKFWEIRLFWSEFRNGQWTAPRLSEEFVKTVWLDGFTDFEADEIYSFKALFVNGDLAVRLYRYTLAAHQWPLWDFRFTGTDGAPTVVDVDFSPEHYRPLVAPKNTYMRYTRFVENGKAGDKLYLTQGNFPSIPTAGGDFVMEPVYDAAREDILTLNQTPGTYALTTPHQDFQFASKRPFFFQDARRAYFVDPVKKKEIAGWVVYPGPEFLDEVLDPYLYYDVPLPHVIPEPPAPDVVGGIGGMGGGDPVPDDRMRFAFEPSAPLALPGSGEMTLPGDLMTSPSLMVRTTDLAPRTMASPMVMSGGMSSPLSRDVVSAGDAIVGSYVGGISVWDKGIPLYLTKTIYDFQTFYHPYAGQFMKELRRDGLDGLMQRKLQVQPYTFLTPPASFSFNGHYHPQDGAVKTPYPVENVDFTARGAYSLYNWELFFHGPLLIATQLSRNQRFEDAQNWFHYIFDPTDASSLAAPKRFWRMGLFFNTVSSTYQKEKIEKIMLDLAGGTADADTLASVKEWRDYPFNPHLVARLRTTAFQKTVVMKYIDNLIQWGDSVFRQARDPEQLNEATQLYILAAEILGRRPEQVAPRGFPLVQTYNQLEPKLDLLTEHFANVLVEAEALIPAPPDDSISAPADPPPVTLPAMMYFAVPKNEKLLGYWDTVADRLFKIRHGLDVEGNILRLPLFEPPIDPALLVKAAASGLDLGSLLSDINAPIPPYRFQTMSQKSSELAQEVKGLGQALLSALEKRDAEALSLLRSSQEVNVLNAVREVRKKQIDESKESLAAAEKSKELIQLRLDYYRSLISNGYLEFEDSQLGNLGTSKDLQTAAAVIHGVVAILALFPEIKVGCPTTIGVTFGGQNLGGALTAAASALSSSSGVYSTMSSMAATSGSFARRAQEWAQQVSLAGKELEQADKQIAAAQIRQAIAEKELANQELQIRNAEEVEDFLKDKFTNKQLYSWMVTQISGVYFQSYQLAYDVAKRAERCYRYELGLDDSDFIRFGYWDGLKKGLLAGDKLFHDVKRLEASFLDQNKREYELTKIVSLALTDPAALLALQQTGECFVTLPESIFDQDHPGHFLRRLKSVALTIPAVAGPYSGVHATLTLMKSTVRKTASLSGGYARTGDDDARFKDVTAPVKSVATSHANNDAGIFELNFRDERYLPFEGRGAESRWRLVLDKNANAFEFSTVTDVLFHVNYTAREGGDALKTAAKTALPTSGTRIFSLRQEFSTEWHRFLHPADTADSQSLVLDLKGRFPFHLSGVDPEINRVDLYLKVKDLPPSPADIPLELYDNPSATGADLLDDDLATDSALSGLHHAGKDFTPAKVPGVWTIKAQGSQIPPYAKTTVSVDGTPHHHLDPDKVEDLFLLIHYDQP